MNKRTGERAELLLRHSKAHIDAARLAAVRAGYSSIQHFLRECVSRLINGDTEADAEKIVREAEKGPSTEEALKACVIAEPEFAEKLAKAAEEIGLETAAEEVATQTLPSETSSDMKARILHRMKHG